MNAYYREGGKTHIKRILSHLSMEQAQALVTELKGDGKHFVKLPR